MVLFFKIAKKLNKSLSYCYTMYYKITPEGLHFLQLNFIISGNIRIYNKLLIFFVSGIPESKQLAFLSISLFHSLSLSSLSSFNNAEKNKITVSGRK